LDRLIAIVALRLRLEARAISGSRGRALGLLVALPALVLFSAFASFAVFTLVRLAARAQPDLLLPALSAVATLFGLSWALSPLVAGIAATESHDLTRLMPYPVPLATLILSTLVANLLQPTVLAQLPPLVALAIALGGVERFLPAFLALGLGLLLVLAAGQTTGLLLHALSRNRRLHDRAIFAGIAAGVLLSLVPVLLLSRGGSFARRVLLALLRHDVFALSPFAWSARAVVHAGRGEGLPFAALSLGVLVALAATLGISTFVARRLYRGEVVSGEAGVGAGARARIRLPGRVGALVEKELRVVWRDPRLKAVSLSGLIGPLLVLFLLGQGSPAGVGPGQLFAVAQITGLGAIGSNALALERHGLGLLFGFPVDRFTLLLGKNLAFLVLRGPVLVSLALAAVVMGGIGVAPAVVALLLVSHVLASAADNYLMVLFPVAMPAAGRDPNAPTSGTRGLGGAAMGLVAMMAALVASAPFAFLVWLPYLLDRRWLWLPALPLALAGACGVYFMATSGAARLLLRREPELLAGLRGEE
jgi:ABC-2 type transport system permease protein